MSAKKIRDEIMKMTIVVNSNPAQQEIYALTTKNRELKKEMQDYRAERKKVASSHGRASKEYKALTQKINETSDAIKNNNSKIKQLEASLDVTEMSVKQLRKEYSKLRDAMGRTVPGSEQYNALQERINVVKVRLDEVRNGAKKTSISFKQLADRFNHYSGIITVVMAVLVGFGLSVQSVIDRNNKMADAMSGVEKTANLTKQEIKELTDSFLDFDTRTSKIDLLKIAEVGGRLGVAKEELTDFTREVDKAYVALGDSWKGGVDSLTDSLGIISKLYAETKDQPIAQSINEIGSALNELAAQGASSEQNIANFVQRMGSVPAKLRPSLNTLLGFGSALEESGIKADIGASGFSKFIRVAAKETDKFAQVMGEPLDKVKELINQDPSAFFLKFAEGVKGLDATELAKVLDSLKLNDNEVIKVLGAASENTDRFRRSVELANQSVAEGTSLQNEFNKVNNNAAGIYEKVRKKIASAFTSKIIAEFINNTVTAFGRFIGVVEDTDETMTDLRHTIVFMIKIISIAIVTTLSYNAALLLSTTTLGGLKNQLLGYTVVQKVNNALNKLGIVLQSSWNLLIGAGGVLIGRLTGATALQTAAQQRLNLAMASNPFGAILAVVTLLITAYFAFRKETDEVSKSQKILNDLKTIATNKVVEEKTAVEQLLRIARDENQSKQTRINAIKELNKISPEYLGNLTLETIKTKEATDAVGKYVAALDKKAMAEALQAKKVELYKQRNDLQSEGTEKYVSTIGGLGQKIDGWSGYKTKMSAEDANRLDKLTKTVEIEKELSKYSKVTADAYWERRKAMRENYVALKTISEKQLDFEKKNAKVIVKGDEEPTPDYKPIDPKSKVNSSRSKRNAKDNNHRQEMEQIRRHYEEASQLEIDLSNEYTELGIQLMEEGKEKKLAVLQHQEKKKLQEIEKQKVTSSDFARVNAKIEQAKGDDKLLFEKLKESWLKNNHKLEQMKLRTLFTFAHKRRSVMVKHQQDDIKSENKLHQKKLGRLKRGYHEDLASFTSVEEMKATLRAYYSEEEVNKINSFEGGKKALKKAHQQKELEELSKHLKKMLDQYEGLDLSILSDEQKENVLAKLEELKNKLAEVAAKKTELTNGKSEGDLEQNPLSNLGGSGDILGMNPEQWDQLFSNLETGTHAIETMQAAIHVLQSAFSTYYSYVKAQEQAQARQIDVNAKRKERRLKRMLNTGELNQKQYEEAVQLLNEETERKKAKLEYESAKRQRAIQIGQIIANTAQAIMSIWAQVPKFDFGATAGILTGVVSALGALQIATVLKTPLPSAPGFEDGFGMEFNMVREQDGKHFKAVRKPLKSGLVDRPTHFIAGENGVEMVIDSPTYTSFRPEVKKILHDEIAYAKGYEGGYYPYLGNEEKKSDHSNVLMEIISKNTETMESVKNKTFRAYLVKDLDTAKQIIEITEEYKELEESAKR